MIDFFQLNQVFSQQEQHWYDEHFDKANSGLDGLALGDGIMLDLGIGGGLPTRRILKANPGLSVVGVDYDASSCQKALMNLSSLDTTGVLVPGDEYDTRLPHQFRVTIVHDNIFGFASRFGKEADYLLLANLHWYSPTKPRPSSDDLCEQKLHAINQIAFNTLLSYLTPQVVKDGGHVLRLELLDAPTRDFFSDCCKKGCEYESPLYEKEIGTLQESLGSTFNRMIIQKTNRLSTFEAASLVTEQTARLCKDVLILSYDRGAQTGCSGTDVRVRSGNLELRTTLKSGEYDVELFSRARPLGGLSSIPCAKWRACPVYYQAAQE